MKILYGHDSKILLQKNSLVVLWKLAKVNREKENTGDDSEIMVSKNSSFAVALWKLAEFLCTFNIFIYLNDQVARQKAGTLSLL